jgi:hypothetical protein
MAERRNSIDLAPEFQAVVLLFVALARLPQGNLLIFVL